MNKINLCMPKPNSFTFIRTIFCLIVIFDHTWQISDERISFVTGLGRNLSVPIFFILSGFWVTMSCLRSNSTKEYALKRFRKIFPSYWLVVIACAFIFVFFSELPAQEYFSSSQFLKYLIANPSTMNFLCINLPGTFFKYGIDGALWPIKIEVGFYIILPLILLIGSKISLKQSKDNDTKSSTPLILICIILYMISIACKLTLPLLIQTYHLPQSFDHQLPSQFCYFVAGMLCLFNLEHILHFGKFYIIPSLIIAICYLVFRWKILFLFFPMALAISLIYIGFKIPIFSKMKDFSYGMYLVHCPIINILTFTNIFRVHPIMGLIFVVGMSFACAYILEKVIFIKLLNFKLPSKITSQEPAQ